MNHVPEIIQIYSRCQLSTGQDVHRCLWSVNRINFQGCISKHTAVVVIISWQAWLKTYLKRPIRLYNTQEEGREPMGPFTSLERAIQLRLNVAKANRTAFALHKEYMTSDKRVGCAAQSPIHEIAAHALSAACAFELRSTHSARGTFNLTVTHAPRARHRPFNCGLHTPCTVHAI